MKESALMKYIIFGLEIIAFILWWTMFHQSIGFAILGTIVIILVSQILHVLFKAR